MLFNSLEFAIFLPTVTVLWWLLPRAWRWVLLLIASYVFYMAWEPAYALLLLAATAVDWFVALRLAETADVGRRRAWLGVSLVVNLGMLVSFKYYNLINGTFALWMGRAGVEWPLPEMPWLLPVGISFYTFQTMSYVIDVYRGSLAPERSFGMFALYVSFFPQLVAGPIERATRLLPQLRAPAEVDRARFASGLRLAAWGMFKKVVVADRLAVLVNAVYSEPTSYGGFAYVLAMVFFSWQVYCDFSGYSDVAIGVARMFGVDLMKNFDQPYGSRSMTEFWTRWHISLSTWFRDYLYFPLGGNRVGPIRWSLNVLLVFLVSGLWHGAEWRFAIWGIAHGLVLAFERFTMAPLDRLAHAVGLAKFPRTRAAIAVGVTQVVWMLTLVPFRANSAADAFHIWTHLPQGWSHLGELDALLLFLARVQVEVPMFLFCLLLIPLVAWVESARRAPGAEARWDALAWPARWGTDYALLFGILALGFWVDTPFVYFQF